MDWKENFLYPLTSPLAKVAISILSGSRLPPLRGEQHLKGLRGPVEILRDCWQVPHIFAADPADVLFAQGYVHAQERLWQMDFNRRVVAGRLSEIIGKNGLEADRVMRTLGFRRVAELEASDLPEPVCSLTEAFCQGVNAWIETAIQARRLPVEFSLLRYEPEPWTPTDVCGWAKLMSWILAANYAAEFLRGQVIQRLGKEKAAALELDRSETWAAVLDSAGAGSHGPYDPTRPFTSATAGEGAGSNNWVIHGARTASGKPLLANDMHLSLTVPSIWFENHLVSEKFEVTGVSLPGAPLVIAGHNRHVAWGFTDGLPDVQDLYEEHLRITPEGATEYEFAGEWLPASVRQEEIHIKGGGAVIHEVVSTRHGPLVNLLFQKVFPDAPPLALRWTALEPETTFQAIYAMNTARECAEFHQALRLFSGPSQNVVYADVQGNIGYTLHGRVPIRARGDGSVPSPGWTGEYEWLGYVPFESLPHLENPQCGFVATANNPQIRGAVEPFLGRDYCSTDRAGRITELIKANPKVDFPYMKKMHYDLVSLSARIMASYLSALQVTDPEMEEAVRQMRDWDGHLHASSTPAVIYEATMREAVRLVLEHHLGGLGMRLLGKEVNSGMWDHHSWEWFIHLLDKPTSPWFDLGSGEQRDDVLSRALRLGLITLKQRLGPDMRTWTWGRLHTLTFRHILGGGKPLDAAFNLGPWPIGGDGTTIWASFTRYYDLSQEDMTGPPYRFIADLSDIDHCWGMLAPGQSGHPGSLHYGDGVKPWLEGDYHPVLVRRDEIEQNLCGRLKLIPEDGG